MGQVIHLFGASGSGTTTLGKALCKELNIHHMDTDDYFWRPTDPKFTTARPRDERIRLMEEDIQRHGNVVISGSLTDWGDVLIPRFTLAVRLEVDPKVRMLRLIAREQERYGDRITPGGDMYRQHLDFISWAQSYDTAGPDVRSKAKHDIWQNKLTCPLLQLDGGEPIADNLQKILHVLNREKD